MPPKKKKPASNVVVVGTVSTRSTRRQSIVNIQIPKTPKLKASSDIERVHVTTTTSTINSPSESSFSTPKGLTEKIKETYNKMFNRIGDGKCLSSNRSSVKLETTSFINTITSPSKSGEYGKALSSSSKRSSQDDAASVKSKFKSNKALLQILEDWTDDDSQDAKRDTPDMESSDSDNIKYFDKLTVKEETGRNSDGNESSEIIIECSIKNSSPSDESPIKSASTNDIKRETIRDNSEETKCNLRKALSTNIEENVQVREVHKNESIHGSETDEVIEIIVEENESVVIEEPVEETVSFGETDYIVECVTEEVICEDNVVVGPTDDSSASYMTEDIAVVAQEAVTEVEMSEDISPKSCEGQKPAELGKHTETITENLVLEETSQSVSTTDSNDAEVRSYFSKEIENNEIVKEEDIPSLKYELIKGHAENKNESDNSEESTRQSENTSEEVESEEKETNKTPETGSRDGICELEEILNKSDASFDESIYSQQSFKQEEILEIIGQGVETKMFRKSTFEEKMDVTESEGEESLEMKVAKLHLKTDTKKDDLCGREEVVDIVEETQGKRVEENIGVIDNQDEEIEGRKTENIENVEKSLEGVKLKEEDQEESDKKMDVDDVEETAEQEAPKVESELPVDRPKTRRTRSLDSKSPTKPQKETTEPKPLKPIKPKATKERKALKPKETKPKETKKDPKSKKKTTPTVTSKKLKLEKKESSKKPTKTGNDQKVSKSDTEPEDVEVRRSDRIKSISVLKKKTSGHGLVRSKSEPILNESDVSDSSSAQTESEKTTPSASPKVVKERKTRWTRSSDNLASDTQPVAESVTVKSDAASPEIPGMDVDEKPKLPARDAVVEARLKQFIHLKENVYKTDRMTCKEAKKMTCDCFLTTEEVEADEYGCGEDCLNRLLLIECGGLCQVGDRCTNKRFQRGQFAPVEVFNTEKKGLGLRAAANIPYGEFILEYVGEVLNCEEFDKRAEVYSQDKNIHYYFMSLRADAIIDATVKGNISRFINHSCDPNAETQKWTVNGELRIGFFSTRTILAGEEITFDYRFQRYGKEAQKCYCEASICRGWLGDQPDEDSEDEDEEEDEEEEETEEVAPIEKVEPPTLVPVESEKLEDEQKPALVTDAVKDEAVKVEKETEKVAPATVTPKRKSPRKKPRKDIFEDLDQLDEEIEMLVTTGLKNQAHTLKLSRLMVRAKEPTQRAKLLRILRRGELPCRRLFLDYHGLRLMHGYMIDAQHLVRTSKKYESVRLEMLQTLAVLPIPNKTMLQDSKVLPTVENWATNKDVCSPQDSDSNSPKTEQDAEKCAEPRPKEPPTKPEDAKPNEGHPERSIEDQEEEIRFLATKLLEEWANLKEVFRIPKKERIEQMKEHEREANKKFMQSGYGGEQPGGRKSDRYRHLARHKSERDGGRKGAKGGEKPSAEFIRLSKIERRKLFALQHELKEEERRLKQREMWRQHEMNCMMIGTDPRFTAPFDPNRGYQYIWNPQIGQWQNYPLPPQNPALYPSQPPTPISTSMTNPMSSINLPPLPNLSMPPPQMQIPKSIPAFSYPNQMGLPQLPTSMGLSGPVQAAAPASVPQMHMQTMPTIPPLPQSMPTHSQMSGTIPNPQVPVVQYQDPVKEEDPSEVKFMGPIPPPVKLPPKWKCAKDKYGRPYYYHIKIRKSQWEPPPLLELPDDPEDSTETESSSETSSVSSDSSSENSDSDDEIDDTKLLMEVRKQMEKTTKLTTVIPDHVKTEETSTPSPDDITFEDIDLDQEEELSLPPLPVAPSFVEDDVERPSIDIRLKEQFDLLKDDKPAKKKRRVGLCEEILISPRTEEDKQQFKEDMKRYKANKEKLRRQKELILQQTKKQMRELEAKKAKEKRARATLKSRIKEMPDFNSEAAKKIKENFRSNMASTVVGALNGYRKPDCKEGRITNTEDFKHLARKLTHFVMLKEMKHIAKIEDLTCTDNVKAKAREYIRKYMSKFGEVYIKRNDSPDFKD